MRSLLLAGGVAVLLCSCATPYVPPVGVATATLTLSADLSQNYGSWVLVQNFDDESCAPSANGNRLASFSTRAIQGEGDDKGGVTRAIPANRPMVYSFIYQRGAAGFTEYTTCVVTQSFVPAAGARYRAFFWMEGEGCSVALTREDGADPGAVGSLRLVEPVCFNHLTG